MPEPKQMLNVAMIGHGFIGKVHSNAFHQVGHFFPTPYQPRLKIICGRNRAKLEAVASQWGWEEVSTDWRAVVERKDIQVVDIAVPNVLHAPITMAAAAAGKIVLCEKPLAMSRDEAERMATAVRHLPNLVWFNYRRVPAVAFAKTLLNEGRVGQIFHYRALYLNQSGNDPAKTSGWRYQRAIAGSGSSQASRIWVVSRGRSCARSEWENHRLDCNDTNVCSCSRRRRRCSDDGALRKRKYWQL